MSEQIEAQLGQEWQAAQLAQQHVAVVLTQVMEAWRKDRAELELLRAQVAAPSGEDNARNSGSG